MDPRILELCRRPPHYAYEAYDFVCDAVTHTQERLGRTDHALGPDDPSDDQHVSGAELARGLCELAVREFGMMAPVVFRQWNVHTTDDIGRMVFDLIDVGRLSKSDRDSPEDFHDLFDLPQALADGFAFTLEDRPAGRRGDR